MKNKKTLIVIILAFVLLIGGASVLYDRLSQDAPPEQMATLPTEPSQPQSTAPDFVVYDEEGNEVRLSDFFGKPIVLNFWASWCGPCRMEMPHFQEKFEDLGGEVTFLMLNVTGSGNDTKSAALKLIEDGGYTFPVFFDMDLDATITYGVSGFPTTFFINELGQLVSYVPGAVDAATLQRGIDMIKK